MKTPRSRLLGALGAASAVAVLVPVAAVATVGTTAATKTTRLYDVAPGFTPTALTVKAGTRLVWKADRTNTSNHTVTLDSDYAPRKARFFDSREIGPGRSYSRVLTVKGRYRLYCKTHPGMNQDVTVR